MDIFEVTFTAAATAMEIAILVILFLIGTIGAAIQALRYVERQQKRDRTPSRPNDDAPD